VDIHTGTAGNDTFIADDTQTLKVTSAADVLNGGAGTDSLTIFGTPNAIPQISNIENVEVDSMAAAGTANFATVTGIQTMTIDRAVGAATVGVNNGVAVTLSNNAAATGAQTVNFGATDTSASLTLNNINTSTNVAVTLGGTNVSTVNIATTGAASSIGNLSLPTTMKTVNVSGDQNLTILDALDADLTTLNAASLTGKLTVTSGAVTDAGAVAGVDGNDLSITGGSGNDSINVSAADEADEVAVDAGAGNDTVTINTTAYTAATPTSAGDNIKGGAGADILAVAGNIHASNMSAVITGFETIRFTTSAAATDMSVNRLGITDFHLSGANTDVVLSGLTATTTVKITDANADLTASLATLGTADTLTVTLESTSGTGTALIANSHDVVNIVSTKAAADAATVVNELETTSATSAATLNISGDTELTIVSAALQADAAVNAAAMSGKLTSTFITNVRTYTGGTGNDVLSIVAGGLKQGNTFAGGTGTDTLNVKAAASQDMGIVGLTGFETLNLTTAGANVGDFRNVTGLTTVNVTGSAAVDDLTLNRLSADTTLSFGASIDQVVTTLNTGTSQKVAFSAAATVTNITLDSGTTSLTVTSDDGNATADEAMGVFTDIDGTSLASITVLGKDRTNLGTLEATTTSVDASGATGGLTVTASATATSIIGSQAADAITGGSGNDTITGGAGNDTIVGGAGVDSITGGAGNDTITLGAGSDVLVFTSHGAANADTITDYSVAEDSIHLSLAAFAGLGVAGVALSGTAFLAGAGANAGTDAAHRIVYNTTNGELWFDSDGNAAGGAAAVLIGTFTGNPALVAAEFTIIT